MRCEHCHENEATITFTIMEDDKTKEQHLCSSCFQSLIKEQFPTVQLPPLDIQSVMQELLSMFQGSVDSEEDRTCPRCHTSLSEVRKAGMFGCDECYNTFAEELDKVLPRIQGAKEHVGEGPKAFRDERALNRKQVELQRELDRAVAEERYEDAAVLRDDLKALEVTHDEG